MRSPSQPALSMQMRELEETLGIELIERRPGAPMLTDLGIEIAQRGGAILGAVRDVKDLAQHRAKVLSGTLHLGVIPTLAPYVLPYVLPQLDLEHPDLRLDLLEAQTKELLAELERGALDVLLLALPLKMAEFETVRSIQFITFSLSCPPKTPCRKRCARRAATWRSAS